VEPFRKELAAARHPITSLHGDIRGALQFCGTGSMRTLLEVLLAALARQQRSGRPD